MSNRVPTAERPYVAAFLIGFSFGMAALALLVTLPSRVAVQRES